MSVYRTDNVKVMTMYVYIISKLLYCNFIHITIQQSMQSVPSTTTYPLQYSLQNFSTEWYKIRLCTYIQCIAVKFILMYTPITGWYWVPEQCLAAIECPFPLPWKWADLLLKMDGTFVALSSTGYSCCCCYGIGPPVMDVVLLMRYMDVPTVMGSQPTQFMTVQEKRREDISQVVFDCTKI